MPPNTLHVVLSTTDCAAEGGHFYLEEGYYQTMIARRNEHLYGHENTNTQHVGAEMILHGLVNYYFDEMQGLFGDSLRKSFLKVEAINCFTKAPQLQQMLKTNYCRYGPMPNNWPAF
jgi:hypothetical protein